MSFSFPGGADIEDVAASKFPKMRFDDVEFPYTDLSVKGGIRETEHEFPHSPGAEIEKGGRKAYRISVTALFHDIPGSALDEQYPNLYPNRLQLLQEKFEKELTAELVVPTIGTMKCVATTWTRDFNAKEPTGEAVKLEFVEDSNTAEAFDLKTLSFGVSKVLAANDALLAAVALADFKSTLGQSIFQDINDAITEVQGALDTADAYSRLVAGKFEAVANLCSTADAYVSELQDPMNSAVLDALKDVWASAQDLAENVVETRSPLLKWRVTRKMSVNQIAMTLYGSTDRTMDILQLNAFEDALEVPAGFLVTYEAP